MPTENTGVISDETIEYTSKPAKGKQLQPVRLVTYECPDTGQRYQFITNNFEWEAQLVADLYKQRWQ